MQATENKPITNPTPAGSIEFRSFTKIPRLSRQCVVSEKIDGTNAQIQIEPNPEGKYDNDGNVIAHGYCDGIPCVMLAGSRNRWLTLSSDNFGFARWAFDNADNLFQLGQGAHFGEWWGSGIQRGYGYKNGERFFSLFNATRWCVRGSVPNQIPTNDPRIVKMQQIAPACCLVVPVLWKGVFDTDAIEAAIEKLRNEGSQAAKGFMNPEGVIVFHEASNSLFKKTLENDNSHKSL